MNRRLLLHLETETTFTSLLYTYWICIDSELHLGDDPIQRKSIFAEAFSTSVPKQVLNL
ncbi:MAG: hypothetical protein GY820_01525 [Gammaproteobacteria bacterium]|nr:hypothetical protein [Gammaproteobacteria bacterium]